MDVRKRQTAFSLIELVIVVAIIAVVGAIAIPRLSRGAEGAGINAFAVTLGELVSAVEYYDAEHGQKPDQVSGNKMPDVIAGQFHGDRGSAFSALNGGEWRYMLDSDGTGTVCAKFDAPPSEAVMQEVDAMLDDGDLSTGLFYKKSAVMYEMTVR